MLDRKRHRICKTALFLKVPNGLYQPHLGHIFPYPQVVNMENYETSMGCMKSVQVNIDLGIMQHLLVQVVRQALYNWPIYNRIVFDNLVCDMSYCTIPRQARFLQTKLRNSPKAFRWSPSQLKYGVLLNTTGI